MGTNTTTITGLGDGSSDVFVVEVISDNDGIRVQTSSAVQIITAVVDGDDSVNG